MKRAYIVKPHLYDPDKYEYSLCTTDEQLGNALSEIANQLSGQTKQSSAIYTVKQIVITEEQFDKISEAVKKSEELDITKLKMKPFQTVVEHKL